MKGFTVKRLTILTLALLAIVPAAALADTTPSPAAQSQARQDCTTLQTSLTAAIFKQAYGTNANRSNAFGKCVAKLAGAEQQNLTTAAGACRTEQNDANFAANHGKTFDQTYGTGNLKNAFGKCVSAKAKAASTQDVQAVENAAKMCSAERAANPAAFKTYGTNANKSNAFGKCVSTKAKI